MAYKGNPVGYGDTFRKLTDEINKVMTPLEQLETSLGNLSTLNTTNKTSLIGAINEVDSDIQTHIGTSAEMFDNVDARLGVLASLNTVLKSSLVGAVNEVNTKITNYITATNTKIADIEGSLYFWLASVDTFADIAITYPSPKKFSTVEVKATGVSYRYNGSSWVSVPGLVPPDTSSEAVAGLDVKIGDLSNLDTLDKTDIVSAINEVYAEITGIATEMNETAQQLGVM